MSKKPVFGYKGMVFATLSIGGLSMGVWAHHMYTTGAVLLPFFAALTLLIAVPTGIKFFNWIGTMWRGTISLDTPMLFCLGFLVMFLFGGITGVILAQPVLDFQLHDTYFVVAHFHYVLFGGSVFAAFAGHLLLVPEVTGRMLDERWGKISFVVMFIGFNLTLLPAARPRPAGHAAAHRDLPAPTWAGTSSTCCPPSAPTSPASASSSPSGTCIISYRKGAIAGDNPWDGQTLEWACSSPPPEHNFESLPPIRSERPVWDANHPRAAHEGWSRSHEGRVADHPGSGRVPGRHRRSVLGAVYEHGHNTEASGIAMLTFSAFAYAILFGYLLLQYLRRQGHPRPEDSFDATMADGEGEVAYFPAASIWPAGVGLGLIFAALAACGACGT